MRNELERDQGHAVLANLRVPHDLPEAVRRAQPMARQVLLRGIGDLGGYVDDDDILPHYVAELIGHDGPEEDESGAVQNRKLQRYEFAAYALGIAVGLHMRASAFDVPVAGGGVGQPGGSR